MSSKNSDSDSNTSFNDECLHHDTSIKSKTNTPIPPDIAPRLRIKSATSSGKRRFSAEPIEGIENGNVKKISRNEHEKGRRDRLNGHIVDLAKALPVVRMANRKLDKLTILRLAVSYLRLHKDFGKINTQLFPQHLNAMGDFIPEILNQMDGGFLLLIHQSGILTWVSEGVTSILGHSLLDLIGTNVNDIVHEDDWEKLNEVLSSHRKGEKPCQISIRLQTVKSYEFQSKNYKMLNMNGFYKYIPVTENSSQETEEKYLVAACKVEEERIHLHLAPPEMLTDSQFITHADLDGVITHADQKSILFSGFMPYQLALKSVFNLIHHDDIYFTLYAHIQAMRGAVPKCVFRAKNSNGDYYVIVCTTYPVNDNWNNELKKLVIFNEVPEPDQGLLLIKEHKNAVLKEMTDEDCQAVNAAMQVLSLQSSTAAQAHQGNDARNLVTSSNKAGENSPVSGATSLCGQCGINEGDECSRTDLGRSIPTNGHHHVTEHVSMTMFNGSLPHDNTPKYTIPSDHHQNGTEMSPDSTFLT